MLPLNNHLFLLLNADTSASPTLVEAAKFIASDVIWLVPVLLIALWVRGRPERRGGLAAVAVAAALALGANQIIGQLWYEPRPFMVGIGRTLMPHVPENSFPSDHTTLMLAVGIGLIATRAAPRWGNILVVLGALVAWARIYVGLHFPLDMLASALIAGLFAAVATVLISPIQHWVIPLADRAYYAALDILRLPAGLFPRHKRRN